jgi:Bacterial Ig-like domain (group 3)/MBG domain (YGX type)/Dockerin type I domain
VAPLPADSLPTFTVSWSGSDDPGGSGIASYDVYVSDDGGPFTLWQDATTETSATYHGVLGHTYAFYSIARDDVGHVEGAPSAPDATIQVIASSVTTTTSLQLSSASPTYGDSLTFTATVTADSPDLGTPTGTVRFLVDGVDFGPLVTLVNGVANSDPIASLGAGPHTLSAVYSGDSIFTGSTADDLSLTVAKAHLTVSADDLSMAHSDTVPALTYTITGFVNGDTAAVVSGAPELSTQATPASAAGRYPIDVAIGSLAAGNYDFPDLVAGTLTVRPKVVDVRVEWGNQSMSILGLNRDLPFLNIKALDVIFSDDVAVDEAAMSLRSDMNPGYVYSLDQFSDDAASHKARWTLPTALDVDRLMLALDGDDAASDGHDGIQSNPDIYLGPFSLKFAVLPGDFNGDGVVNAQDMVGVRNQMQGTGDPSQIGWADFDGNGVINIDDYNLVRKRIGKHL